MYPDISIIGAPKCGTSSVYAWLSRLKGVCSSVPKETFFFMDDDNPLKNPNCNFHDHGIGSYETFFPNLNAGKTLDATTHYLFQQTAANQLSKSNSKICLILRDPAKRVLSYFDYVCTTRAAVRSPIQFDSFVDALIDGDTSQFRGQFYEEREYYALATSLTQGIYIQHIQRWCDRFPTDNFKLIIFEHLVRQQDHHLRSLAKFFGLPLNSNAEQKLPKENQTISYRFPRLNRCARYVSKFIGPKLKSLVRKTYYQMQAKPTPTDSKTINQAALKKLSGFYRSYNTDLASFSGLDLDQWS